MIYILLKIPKYLKVLFKYFFLTPALDFIKRLIYLMVGFLKAYQIILIEIILFQINYQVQMFTIEIILQLILEMGATCVVPHKPKICTFSSNATNQNGTDFVLEQMEIYDNPHRQQLSSKFLQTKIAASNNLLDLKPRKTVKMVKMTSIGLQADIIEDHDLPLAIQSVIHKNRMPSVKISLGDFIITSKKKLENEYKILQKIGAGSYGEVFKAMNIATGDIRAIKAIKKHQYQMYSQEIEILKSCDHPNVIQIYEVFEEKLFCYVVMQYCSGGSIIQLIKQKKYLYHEGEARTIIEQILHALVYLHGKEIVHRDIKLENVVFMEPTRGQSYTSNLKIIDFGNSKKVKYKVNNCNNLGGTTTYMPPEAFSGWFNQSFDLWSCGVLLYILLCGSCPFKGRNKQQTINLIKTKQVKFTESQWINVSKQAKQFVMSLLNKDFMKRPTASQCLDNIWFSPMNKSQVRKASQKFTKNLQKYYIINNFVSIVESYLSFIRMSQSQKGEIKQLFQAIDTERKGYLSKKDIEQCNEVKLGKMDEQIFSQLFEAIDKNKSGFIDYSEFQTVMSNRQKLFMKQSLKVAFDHFDTDNSGYIEKSELVLCLKDNIGDIDGLIQEIDIDNDDRISKQQFLEYFDKIQVKLAQSYT